MTDVALIWQRFHKELREFAIRKTKSTVDADDILQEVFINIIRNSEKVSKAHHLKQYLFAIVRNAITDHFRNEPKEDLKNRMPEELTDDESQSLNSIIADCCINPFIDRLPDKYREAIILADFQMMPQKNIAEKLNISYSGAKSRVQRGREKLRQLIVNCCPYRSDKYGNLLESEGIDCNCQ